MTVQSLIQSNAPFDHNWNVNRMGRIANGTLGDYNIDFSLVEWYVKKRDTHYKECHIYCILDKQGNEITLTDEVEQQLADHITKKCFEF